MKHTTMTRLLRRSALVVALLGLLAGTVSAQTYDLVADQFTWNGITMWGFAEDTGQTCGAGGAWAPGPVLEALQGDTLTVNLRNCLTVPVSIVIPGQQGALAPVMTGNRMRAFTTEAAAGGSASYTWTGVKAGTYLYHSGSDLATQVHMGLYGALVVDFATGQAYEGVFYDVDVVLLASEVDPALHDPPAMATPLNFKPKYFLASGIGDGSTVIGNATDGPFVNDTVLFRFVNAGLKNYVPTLLGEDMVFVAEDGNPYNFAAPSYGELLPAGKTMDALWTPVSAGEHALFDRRLHLSTNGAPGGGLVATVEVFPSIVPTADAGDDQLHVPLVTGGSATVVQLTGAASGGSGPVYTYQWSLVAFPAGSSPVLSDPTIANPTFTLGTPGTYTARLVVTDGAGAFSAPDLVNIFTNLPPVAVASANKATVEFGQIVQLFGGNYCFEGDPAIGCTSNATCTASPTDYCVMRSYDPDGDAFGYAWSVTGGALSDPAAANPVWTFVAAGTYSASLTVTETGTTDLLASEPATVQVTVTEVTNESPVANTDFYTVQKNSSGNLFAVLANDTDPDGNADIDPTTVTIKTFPLQGGTVTVDPVTGVITYDTRKGWRGTDYFTYTVKDFGGLESNVASVVVNVVQ